MELFIKIVINFIIVDFIYLALFLIFQFINKKIALYFLALFDAPWCGLNSKKIANYCKKNCSNKKCKNCIYWTCYNYQKNIDKEG